MNKLPRNSIAAPLLVLLALSMPACAADAPDTASVAATAAALDDVSSRGEPTPFEGYTLFNPLRSTSVYLIDLQGELVHHWKTEYNTGQSVYLLDNGNLLKSVKDPEPSGVFGGGRRSRRTARWCGSASPSTRPGATTTTSRRSRTATCC